VTAPPEQKDIEHVASKLVRNANRGGRFADLGLSDELIECLDRAHPIDELRPRLSAQGCYFAADHDIDLAVVVCSASDRVLWHRLRGRSSRHGVGERGPRNRPLIPGPPSAVPPQESAPIERSIGLSGCGRTSRSGVAAELLGSAYGPPNR
jgi:hypothetical protein